MSEYFFEKSEIEYAGDTGKIWEHKIAKSTGGTASSKAFGGSSSFFMGDLSEFVKTGDGSGHSYVAWAQLGDAGTTGYNELGLYQGCLIVDGSPFNEEETSPIGKHYGVCIETQLFAAPPDLAEQNKHILMHLTGQRVSDSDLITDNYIGILLDETVIGLPEKSVEHNQWDKALKVVGDWKHIFVIDEFGSIDNTLFQCRTTGESYPRVKMLGDGSLFYGNGYSNPSSYFSWDSSTGFTLSDNTAVYGWVNASGYVCAGSSVIVSGDIGSGFAGQLRLTNTSTDYDDGTGEQAPKGITGESNPVFGGYLEWWNGVQNVGIPFYTNIQKG